MKLLLILIFSDSIIIESVGGSMKLIAGILGLFVFSTVTSTAEINNESIGIISVMGNKLELSYFGLPFPFIRNEKQEYIDVKEWNIDTEIEEELIKITKEAGYTTIVSLSSLRDEIIRKFIKRSKEDKLEVDEAFLKYISEKGSELGVKEIAIVGPDSFKIRTTNYYSSGYAYGSSGYLRSDTSGTHGLFGALFYLIDVSKRSITKKKELSESEQFILEKPRRLSKIELKRAYEYVSDSENNKELLLTYKNIIYENALTEENKKKLLKLYEEASSGVEDIEDELDDLNYILYPKNIPFDKKYLLTDENWKNLAEFMKKLQTKVTKNIKVWWFTRK